MWSNTGESTRAAGGDHPWMDWMGESGVMLCINPATGLRMTSGGPHGIDIRGNPYGFAETGHSITGYDDADIFEASWTRHRFAGLDADFSATSSTYGLDDGFGFLGSSAFCDDSGDGSFGPPGFDGGGGSSWD